MVVQFVDIQLNKNFSPTA